MHNLVRLNIGSQVVSIYIFVDSPGATAKANQLLRYFNRMPAAHLKFLYPIVVMDRKPGRGLNGGTWRGNEVLTNFHNDAHERNTGIPNAEIQNIFRSHGSQGLIGIPKNRWDNPMGKLSVTIFHEVSHCIHYSYGANGLLARGLTERDFDGVMERECASSASRAVKRALAVYTHYITSPSKLFHNLVPGENARQTNNRLLDKMQQSAAFRSVNSP